MVKPQVSLSEEWNKNGVTSEVNQGVWFLETPSSITKKGELIGPKIVQPPENKTPHIKPVELGGGAQCPFKPTTITPIRKYWWCEETILYKTRTKANCWEG